MKSLFTRNNLLIILSIFIILIIIFSYSDFNRQSTASKIVVFSAISLQDVIEEIKSSFELEKNVEISVSYSGSQKLARQIASGADADIFLSAGILPRDFLNDSNLVSSASFFASNRLVLVAAKDFSYEIKNIQEIMSLPIERISIANPELAPVGVYAKDVLEYYNIWESFREKIIFANNTRDALRYVKSGNVDLAIVYATDVKIISNDKIKVIDIIDVNSHRPIVYTAVGISGSKNPVAAKEFISFLFGDYSKDILQRNGFDLKNQKDLSKE